MIDRMTKYSFLMLSAQKEDFLEELQGLGVVDITHSVKAVDDRSSALLAEIESAKAELQCIRKGSDEHLAGLVSARKEAQASLAAVSAWGEYDRNALNSIPGVEFKFYCLEAKKFNPDWENEYALAKVSEEDGKVWFVVANAPDFPATALPAPKQSLAEAQERLEACTSEEAGYAAELEARKAGIPALEERIASLNAQLHLHLASCTAESAAEQMISVLVGYAPSSENERLKAAFDAMDIYYSAEEACVEDNPPIKLKNNRFVKMFEVLTDMYGRPAYNGFDPTPFISIFFLLFFAMCMGDAGYGIILAIVGVLLKKVKSFSNLAPLVITLGAGTFVVGFFFHTFFSVDISSWAIIPDALKSVMVPAKVAGYDGTMVLALIVGIVHLCLAMIVKTVYATKNSGFLGSLSVWGWTLLIVGGVVVGLIALLGVLDSSIVKIIIIALGTLSALGIFLLNNLHRNPLLNIGSGLWETYNTATGVLGDVLSYLRLYALGLAGSMLGFAFNSLAQMALGDGGLGWIPFILIAVVGHTLNIAMAALGAFVHPLRLNFLEFFKNSGYEGVGLKYNPLKK